MSDERSPADTPEDVAILQALRTFDVLEAEALHDRLRDGDEISDALLRQYTEILGCLAFSVAPGEPTRELEERILLTLSGDETQRIDPEEIGAPVALPRRETAPRAPAPERSPTPSRGPRWLAAVLAVVALGLAGGLFWLSEQLEASRERLVAQEAQLRALDQRLEEARTEQEAAAREEREARVVIQDRFRLVTAAGTEICPMKPPAGSPQPSAVGVLYVAADHQHWYLRAEGLSAPGEDRVFQLWFVARRSAAARSASTRARSFISARRPCRRGRPPPSSPWSRREDARAPRARWSSTGTR